MALISARNQMWKKPQKTCQNSQYRLYLIQILKINIINEMGKMTKSEILAAMAEGTNMSKKEVGEFMEKMTNLAYKEVKNNGEFVLPGIGKLVKVHRKARQGRNPATGETIQIPAKTVVKFRVAKAAKEAVL